MKIVTDKFGIKKYYNKHNQLHREDGPAIIFPNGDSHWCMNDSLHRSDGPAVEYLNGHKEYHYHGKYIRVKSTEEFKRYIKLLAFI